MRPAPLALVLCGLAAPATAEGFCAPRDMLVGRLAERYSERQQSIGLAGNDIMLEVFASEDSGTWTILMTRADGTSCLVASGTAYETVAAAPPGTPS